jgi:uncharacterized membrane protein YhiD involved in acid resistance
MSKIEENLNLFAAVYHPSDILMNMTLACILGVVISALYKATHKGLSYSQSFMLTTIFVTVVVAMVMMVIGNSLAKAFALVGALSIIRFRTVIKDTKDTAYVFMALAAGMAAGTSSYVLAFIGTSVFSVLALILHITNYGSLYKSEFIIRFRAETGLQPQYQKIFDEFCNSVNLLHAEPSEDGHKTNHLTFDVTMKKDEHLDQFVQNIESIEGVSETALIASKSDVDY